MFKKKKNFPLLLKKQTKNRNFTSIRERIKEHMHTVPTTVAQGAIKWRVSNPNCSDSR